MILIYGTMGEIAGTVKKALDAAGLESQLEAGFNIPALLIKGKIS